MSVATYEQKSVRGESEALDNFRKRLGKLDSYEAADYLRGAYKQLVTSKKGRQAQGPIRWAYEKMPKTRHTGKFMEATFEPEALVTAVANELYIHGFSDEAYRLLFQQASVDTAIRWVETIEKLNEIDHVWRKKATLKYQNNGVKINVGDYMNEAPFGASITRDGGNECREIGYYRSYEIIPRFDGKHLTELGFHNDDVIDELPLEAAWIVANAALSEKKEHFEHVVKIATAQP